MKRTCGIILGIAMIMLLTVIPAMATEVIGEQPDDISMIVLEEAKEAEGAAEAAGAETAVGTVLLEGQEDNYNESAIRFTEDGMLILPRPIKKGKIFIEWNTKEDGTGVSYRPGTIIDPTDIVLYSIWKDEAEEQ